MYEFDCVECRTSVRVDVFKLANGQDAAVLGSENATAVKQYFDFNLVGKSHDGGWPRLAAVGRGSPLRLVVIAVVAISFMPVSRNRRMAITSSPFKVSSSSSPSRPPSNER